MSCLKGTSQVKKKEAKYVCDKCGANVKKKSQVCKASKVKGKDKEKGKEKGKEKKK